jgi:hypothetical protein
MSAATVAHAEALGTLSPGVLYIYIGGASPAHGLGGELSFMHSPKNDFKAYGGFFCLLAPAPTGPNGKFP